MGDTQIELFIRKHKMYDQLLDLFKLGVPEPVLAAMESLIAKAIKDQKAKNEAQLAARMKSKLIANPNMSRYFLIHAWQDYAIDSIMCPVITLSPYQRVLQMRKKRQPPPKPQQKPASQPLEIYEPTPKSLVKLPAEIHLQIFSYLDECTSCCLGLTCKTFYAIHHKKHPVTDPACASYGERFETVYLYELLNGFMSRSWCFHQAKMSGYWENDFQTEKLEMEIDCLKAKLYRSYSTYF